MLVAIGDPAGRGDDAVQSKQPLRAVQHGKVRDRSLHAHTR
jgi:hypothetical protein